MKLLDLIHILIELLPILLALIRHVVITVLLVLVVLLILLVLLLRICNRTLHTSHNHCWTCTRINQCLKKLAKAHVCTMVAISIHLEINLCLNGICLTKVIVEAAAFKLLSTVPVGAAPVRAAAI